MKSFLVAVTNPKGYLFVGALMPQFIAPSQPQLPQYVVIAIVFAAIDFTIMFVYAAFGTAAVRMLKRSGALWLDRICGAILLALAGSLAFLRRASAAGP
jgi:threonine/homoserine/homoserine lactone efflux protein